jgi:hypothetical protein
VRSQDFSGLLALFAEDAEMRFQGLAAGPFTGKSEIAAAFRARGPSDELILLDDEGAYAWQAEPKTQVGHITIGVEAGKIVSVLVSVA